MEETEGDSWLEYWTLQLISGAPGYPEQPLKKKTTERLRKTGSHLLAKKSKQKSGSRTYYVPQVLRKREWCQAKGDVRDNNAIRGYSIWVGTLKTIQNLQASTYEGALMFLRDKLVRRHQ